MKHAPLTLACLLLLLFALPARAQDKASDLAALKQENAELRAELDRVKDAYDKLEAETAKLRAELAKLTSHNEDLEVEKKQLTELAGLTPSGDRVESAQSRFTTEYDEADDTTTVRTGVESITAKGSGGENYLSLAYSFPGKDMTDPPDYVMLFIQTKFSGGVYDGVTDAVFDIDGQTVTVPIDDYQAVVRHNRVANKRTVRKDDESVTIKIDRDLLRQLARAIQVKITLGNVRLEPTRDQSALFRAIQKRIELGA